MVVPVGAQAAFARPPPVPALLVFAPPAYFD